MKSESLELVTIGTEGIGLDRLGTRLDVRPVHLLDHGRPGKIQLVEAAVKEHTLLVQHRPHASVENQDVILQEFERCRS